MDYFRAHVLICGGTGCTSSHSPKIQQEFVEQLEKNNISKEVKIVTTGCFGLCAEGLLLCILKVLCIQWSR